MRSNPQFQIPPQRLASNPVKTVGSTLGDRLLLVGTAEAAVTELNALYRMQQRPAPAVTLFVTASAALERLAEQSFDCIIVANSSGELGQRGVDAPAFCTAIRGAGVVDPILVWSVSASNKLWQAICDAEAELYIGPAPWQSSVLVPLIDRARQHRALTKENQRRQSAEKQRFDRERDECQELLRQQHELSGTDFEHAQGATIPTELPRIYLELLRSYVMTGTNSFQLELTKLVQTFALAHLTPRQVLELHVCQLEVLIKGIGQRSARHILDRANVLSQQVLLLLCECYEQQNARTWWAWRRQPVSDLGVSLERRAA